METPQEGGGMQFLAIEMEFGTLTGQNQTEALDKKILKCHTPHLGDIFHFPILLSVCLSINWADIFHGDWCQPIQL